MAHDANPSLDASASPSRTISPLGDQNSRSSSIDEDEHETRTIEENRLCHVEEHFLNQEWKKSGRFPV